MKKFGRTAKRVFSAMLASVMLFTLAPGTLYAASGDQEAEGAQEEEARQTVYEYSDGDISVTVTLSDAADLPDGAELSVTEVDKGSEEFEGCLEAAEQALEGELAAAGGSAVTRTSTLYTGALCADDLAVYDISVMYGGEEVEPEGAVTVRIEYSEEVLEEMGAEAGSLEIIHLADGGAEIMETEEDCGAITFETDSFSAYAALTVSYEYGNEYEYEIEVFGETSYYYYQYLGGSAAFCGSLGLHSPAGVAAAYIGTAADVFGSETGAYICKAMGYWANTSQNTSLHAIIQTYIWGKIEGKSDSDIDEEILSVFSQLGLNIVSTSIAETISSYASPASAYVYRYSSSTQYLITTARTYQATGYLDIAKASSSAEITDGNSCYSLDGAQYAVYSSKDDASDDADRVHTFTIDEDGASDGAAELDVGTYYVKEVAAGKGYELDSVTYEVAVTEDATAWVNAGTVYDVPEVDPFTILLQKEDDATGSSDGLSGAVYKVTWAPSSGSAAARTWYFETDDDGQVVLDEDHLSGSYASSALFYASDGNPGLPYGYITVQEVEAPEGYVLDSTVYSASFTEDGMEWDLSDTEYLTFEASATEEYATHYEAQIRGGASLLKIDAETGAASAQGGATLAGAEITIYNDSGEAVYLSAEYLEEKGYLEDGVEILEDSDGDCWYEDGEAVIMLTTDEDGYATTDADSDGESRILPYGSYIARETSPSEGYLLNEDWSASFEIEEDGEVVVLAEEEDALPEQIIRGDLSFTKLDEDGNAKAFTPFLISLVVGGEVIEQHVVMTGADGTFDSSALANSNSTNGLDEYLSDDGTAYTGPCDAEAASTGIWFGEVTALDDEKGALIYGSYTIEELSCASNAGEDLLKKEFDITEDGATVSAGYFVDLEVSISTELLDSALGAHMTFLADEVTLTEHIEYTNLKTTSRYYFLVSVCDGEGNVIGSAESAAFSPESDGGKTTTTDGELDVDVQLSTLDYEGEALHAEVTLFIYVNGAWAAVKTYNSDLDDLDADETVYVPSLETTAVDGMTEDGVGTAGETTVIDTVSITNLLAGESYVLYETLYVYDGVTGELLTEETASKTFSVARNSLFLSYTYKYGTGNLVDRTVTMPEFSINAAGLSGLTVVVYEELWMLDTETGEAAYKIAEHKSLTDEDQSIHYPAVGTQASDAETGTGAGVISEAATIIDSVTCSNLVIGKEYTITGTLVYQEDFTYTDSEGNVFEYSAGDEVPYDEDASTDTVTFTAESETEVHELAYVVDSTLLQGTSVVVFEDLYHNEVKVAAHSDINDEGQTVKYPAVSTVLIDYGSCSHEVLEGEELVAVDTVSLKNLIEGAQYKLVSVLIDKESGEVYAQEASAAAGEDASGSSGTDAGAEAEDEEDADTDYSDEDGQDAEAGDSSGSGNEESAGTGTIEWIVETEFAAEWEDGTVDVAFDPIDTTGLADATFVAYEYLYILSDDGEWVLACSHADLDDENQSVHVPGGGTSLSGEGGSKTVLASEDITLVDTVSYSNLIVGKTYTVTGTLMDKETGEALADDDGNAVTASAEFTAESSSGTVDVTFTFSGVSLAGKTIVAFEYMYNEAGRLVFVHADINDEEQTAYVPQIKTTARDSNGSKYVTSAAVGNVIDAVSYTNLEAGTEYTVTGVLMDKDTGKAVTDSSGTAITSSATFTPDASSGTVEMSFTVPAGAFFGTAVVFEAVTETATQEIVAVHQDIDDVDQTVYFPEIGTTLTTESGEKEAEAGGTVTLIDTVSYTNLEAGQTYRLYGTLMDKETGEAAEDGNGEAITAEATFTAESSDGTATVEFTFNSDGMDGDYTAFEYLYKVVPEVLDGEGNIITEEYEVIYASHADLDDAEQTITLYAGGVPKTGDERRIWLWTLLAASAACGICAAAVPASKKKRRTKKEA